MLIAIATLTIATANADGYNWKTPYPIQIVNNTNVTLTFRTWPDAQLFTVESGKTVSGSSSNENELDVAWEYGTQNADVIWRPVFDGYENDQGTMTNHTAWISNNMNQGQAWDIINVGYNDKLVFTGTASGTTMKVTATRTSGVIVVRTDSDGDLADLFCLDTGVEFSLDTRQTVFGPGKMHLGRCPVGETRIVLAEDDVLLSYQWSIDNYDADWLEAGMIDTCDASGTCKSNPAHLLYGSYTTGFATFPYIDNVAVLVYLNGKPS